LDKKIYSRKKKENKKNQLENIKLKKNPKHQKKKKKKTAHICSPIATHMPGTANCFFVWGGRDFYGKKKTKKCFTYSTQITTTRSSKKKI
jgi:hypothetical protein